MYSRLKEDQQEVNSILEQTANAALSYLNNQEELAPFQSIQKKLSTKLPDKGLGAKTTIDVFSKEVAPFMANSAGPRYFGFVTGGSTPASLAGDWLVSTYDNNLSHYSGSIGGEIENQTINFLKELLKLDHDFYGSFVTGATTANFVGLAIARQWIGEQHNHDISENGLKDSVPVKIISAAPHSSIIKSLSMLGLGRSSLIQVDMLPNRESVDIASLKKALSTVKGPVIVVANAGTVNTGDFDDLQAIGSLKHEFNFWLHVDGAFGAFAACSTKHAHLIDGINHADSITVDAHKWLNVPYDSAMIFTKHKSIQSKVFQNKSPYLGDPSFSPDFLHFTPENSRRFRALPAWFTLMAYGREGYQEIIERNCILAVQLGNKIESSNDFRLLAPVNLNIVCFTLNIQNLTSSAVNQFLKNISESGVAFLTPTVYSGTPAIRAAFSNWQTKDEDVLLTWKTMIKAFKDLEKEPTTL